MTALPGTPIESGSTPGDDALRQLGHDLRQPVAAIVMLAAAAGVHRDVPPEVQERLDQITVEAQRISDVCRYLLGELDGLEVVDLQDLAIAVVSSARVTWTTSIDVVTAPVSVRANAVDVWRALTNLIDNACRAAGADGSVLVKVSASAEGARLEVHDSGPGWGKAPPGTASLGLSIVTTRAKAHGGRLETGVSDLGGAVAELVFPSVVPTYLDLVDHDALAPRRVAR
jgi:signal transduction histidine kinase